MTKQLSQQQVKPAAKAKAPAKPKAAKVGIYATIYAAIMAGKLGARAMSYYKNADAYHTKQKTVFPRQRTEAERATMTKEKAEAVITQAQNGTLAAGSKVGQALYDLMRIGA